MNKQQKIFTLSKETNTNRHTPVLIVTEPGRRRDSLRAILRAMPQLKIIGQADNSPAALKIIADHRPVLTLVDSNLPGDEAWTILKQIKTQWSQIRCLVLVDTVEQQRMAIAANADGVLTPEFSITKFLLTIEKLLTEHETTYLTDKNTH